ncbi:MAG: hypothetical protein EOO40_01815 [Deltaproteobacteria bacterium]|nr:MAG: hypothetical protein EOO40_01815 [Deltaproteobacteria bacterium]
MDDTFGDAIATRVSPAKVTEVQRLASTLAARVRYAQMVRRPIPAEQITALIQAARLLAEYEAPWPPLMKQVVNDFSKICQGR